MKWPPPSDWPHVQDSRRVSCRHIWHVQEAGTGPTLLLIHGAGGATQSWRGLYSILAQTHHVVAVDLPGQGFTQRKGRGRCGLEPMAEDLAALVDDQGWSPSALIGHSAGAAIALRMALDRPNPVIGINAALQNFEGVAGWLFPAMAKLLALNPLTAVMVTATMTEGAVRRLLAGTGSKADAEMQRLYHRLASDREHVDATLAMMAEWSLEGLLSRLPEIEVPVTLLVGEGDEAVPPKVSREAARQVQDCALLTLPGLGHLMHEEDPQAVYEAIRSALPDA